MRVCRKEAPVGGARDRICFKSMNTNTLEYILAIAEERSISKAARRFYLSQADLSRHLKRVEKDLGVSLFTRHRDGVELTPAGIIFINDARTILHMEKKLMKDLSVMREQKQYTIRVMTDEPFYNFFVNYFLSSTGGTCFKFPFSSKTSPSSISLSTLRLAL